MAERDILIRVYTGSASSPQERCFNPAVSRLHHSFKCSIKLEYMSLSNITQIDWSPFEFVQWLKESDIHIILTHPHQGISGWDCREVYLALDDLRNHTGFPTGPQLDCPVFKQDKLAYVFPLSHITIPTFRLNLDRTRGIEEQICLWSMPLRRFMETHNEGDGWVVKLPFVTHSEGIAYPKSYDSLIDRFIFLMKNFSHRVPYCMVQPKLCNRMENRVLVRARKAAYHVGVKIGVSKQIDHALMLSKSSLMMSKQYFNQGGRKVQFGCQKERNKFAEDAVTQLGQKCSGAVVDFVMRVDIMCLKSGQMVVNEFESLEANYVGYRDEEMATQEFYTSYWMKILTDCIKRLRQDS
jgi:hypothetical protein